MKLNTQEEEIYRNAFIFFDRNNDGVITTTDLQLVLKKLGLSPSYVYYYYFSTVVLSTKYNYDTYLIIYI